MKKRLKVVVDKSILLPRSQRDRGGATRFDKLSYRIVDMQFLNAAYEAQLDVYCEEGLVITWRDEDYSTLSGLGGVKSVGFRLPKTARNDAILSGVFSIDGRASLSGVYEAWAGYGDRKLLEGLLSLEKKSGKGMSWESVDATLRGNGYLWAKDLGQLSLADLPFRGDGSAGMGEVVFSFANMVQTGGVLDCLASSGSVAPMSGWHLLDRYKEYMALVVNYGFFNESYEGNKVGLRDMRLWFWERDLIYLMFGSLGWRVKSRFIDSDSYRRDLVYVLRDLYWAQDKTNAEFYGFRAEQTGTQNYFGVSTSFTPANQKYRLDFNDDFTSPNHDGSGGFDTVQGWYTAPIDMKVRLSAFLTISHNNANEVKAFATFIVEKVSPLQSITIERVDFNNGEYLPVGVGSYSVNMQSGEVNLSATDRVYINLHIVYPDNSGGATVNFNADLLPGSWFAMDVLQKEIINGDVIRLADLVDGNIFSLDVLRGAAHRYDWRFQTDVANRIVYIEPASDIYVPDAGSTYQYYKGFYGDRSVAIDGDGMIDWCESVSESGLEKGNGVKRRFRLTYKDGDAYYGYISSQFSEVGSERRLFDGEWDLGDAYEEGVTIDENPLYAATANDWFSGFIVPSGGLNVNRFWIPHIWEQLSEQNNIGSPPASIAVKIRPRVVRFYGGVLRDYYISDSLTNHVVTAYPNVGMVNALGPQQSGVSGGLTGIYSETLSYGSYWNGYSSAWGGSAFQRVLLGSRDLGSGGMLRLLGLGDMYWSLRLSEWINGLLGVYVFVPCKVPYGLGLGLFRSYVRINGRVGRVVRWGGVDVGDLDVKGELEVVFLD